VTERAAQAMIFADAELWRSPGLIEYRSPLGEPISKRSQATGQIGQKSATSALAGGMIVNGALLQSLKWTVQLIIHRGE
jgi:hypothetical protein